MNKYILIPILSLALSATVRAEASATLTGVHNCCKSCANGITKAVGSVDGATAEVSGDKVTITAKNKTGLKKAIEALADGGYYGKEEGAESTAAAPAADGKKVKSATVEGVHLCCAKCVKAVDAAVKAVAGVTGHTAESKAKSFTVEGEFSTAELAAALNKAGLNGKIK